MGWIELYLSVKGEVYGVGGNGNDFDLGNEVGGGGRGHTYTTFFHSLNPTPRSHVPPSINRPILQLPSNRVLKKQDRRSLHSPR